MLRTPDRLRCLPSEPDCLEWKATTAIDAYGVKVRVRMDQAAILPRLIEHFPPKWQPASFQSKGRLYSLLSAAEQESNHCQRHRLYVGSKQLADTDNAEDWLEAFESSVQLHVATNAPRYVFVHAGVVAWRGRALVIPGRSYSGKSTLVAALLRAGATYYSDEYAVFDEAGLVHPYPRRLSLRQPDGQRPLRSSAEALGGYVGIEPLPVELVAVTRYRPGAVWQPRRLSQGEAVLALLRHTVPVRRRPRATLESLGLALRHACVLRGWRGETEETVASLLEAVGSVQSK